MYSYNDLGDAPDRVEVAKSIVLIARRIDAESSREIVEQAGSKLMWSAVVREFNSEAMPLSAGKVVLAYGFTILHTLRGVNHDKGRCTCGPLGAPNSQIPMCTNTEQPQNKLTGGPSPDSSYNPVMDVSDVLQHQHQVLYDSTTFYPPCYAAGPELAIEDISDALWKVIGRLMAEINFDVENRKETYDIWKSVYDEGQEAVNHVGPAVLTCLLFRAWDHLVTTRGFNHDAGRCSHYHNELEGSPECQHERSST
jgi:hypothetical protein